MVYYAALYILRYILFLQSSDEHGSAKFAHPHPLTMTNKMKEKKPTPALRGGGMGVVVKRRKCPE